MSARPPEGLLPECAAPRHFSCSTPISVRDAVRRVLSAPDYRRQAQRLAGEYARYDAVARGTAAIEQLCGASANTPREPADPGTALQPPPVGGRIRTAQGARADA